MNINERSRNTAKILIDIGAINFSLATPFRLSSGFLSPSYIDCRKIIAYPSAFKSITDMMIDTIKSDMDPRSPDYIIGGETAGIPFGAVIAEKMGLPLSYVRKKAKDYGKNKLIEGDILQERNSLLVEDLMTDGKSKINFVQNIRSHGIECNLSLVVFKYNIFKEADISMKRNNIQVYHLTDWEDVYNQMRFMNTFDSSILFEIRKFLDNPIAWSDHKNQIKKL
ncbi:orotate phosphoribosyltransferase [Paracoccaceae bacterium]|nr:orotate phosphoribosyltransferase [Paracoccaceae bacterium]